jgi:alpha-L-rhamnosidase
MFEKGGIPMVTELGMSKHLRLLLCAVLVRTSTGSLGPFGTHVPTGLKVNYMTEPLGVDKPRYHFTWMLPQIRSRHNDGQSFAQVIIASQTTGGTVYNSGKIPTIHPQFTAPEPIATESDTNYSWTVSVWNTGVSSPQISEPSYFTTGLLHHQDWNPAVWIRGGNGPTQMRKDFEVKAINITRATLFIAACQYYTLYLDGAVVGDQMLDGPWTSFYTNRSYTTHNIDISMLTPGPHTLGIRVGQGFCNSAAHNSYSPVAERSAIALLRIHRGGGSDADAVVQKVGTDSTWLSSDSPIRSDSPYYGETYDAREEQPGWDSPSFTPPVGKSWSPVSTNFTKVVAQLNSQGMPPIKPVRVLPALTVTNVSTPIPGTPQHERTHMNSFNSWAPNHTF